MLKPEAYQVSIAAHRGNQAKPHGTLPPGGPCPEEYKLQFIGYILVIFLFLLTGLASDHTTQIYVDHLVAELQALLC